MRFGITTSTSEEITKGLRDEGIDVPVINVKKEIELMNERKNVYIQNLLAMETDKKERPPSKHKSRIP